MYKFHLGSPLKGFVLLACAVLAVIETRATVIYRETFGIAPGSVTVDQFATVFDWQRFDNAGQPITLTGSSSGVNYTVNGRPIDVSNVNAGPNNNGTFGPYANGILYLPATPSPNLAFTTEYIVDPSKYVPGSIVFSWYEGNNTAPHFFRLLLRVGGLWYASVDTFASPAVALANFGAQAVLITVPYNPTAAKWQQVSFDGDFVVGATPGTGVSTPSSLGGIFLMDPPAADLSGPITAFGVYGENGGSGTGNRRIDTFTIEATPLVISSNKTVIWTGNTSADWDVTSANWKTNSPTGSALYVDGDIVRFEDGAATNDVNIVPQVLPASLTVSNNVKEFRFIGGGAISGTTSLRKQGSSSLVLANSINSYTGGVLIENGILQVGEGGANGTVGGGNITNNSFLTFNRSGTVVVTNTISGTGVLTKRGDGSLTLTASNSFTGGTTVESGTLILDGVLGGGGQLDVSFAATLTGSGTNAGRTTVSGNLRPGDGIGTLTTGDLSLFATSTNYFELGTSNTIGGGVNDLIQVNGSLTLTNGFVAVILTDLPRPGVPYRLINYTGSRSGIFDPHVIVIGVNRYTAELSYDDAGKAVNLTFIPPATPSMVIYRETFGIAPGATVDQQPSVFDWQRFDNFGQPIFATGSSSGVNYSADGRPTNAFNINAGPNNDGTFGAYRNGILYLGATPSPSLAFTTEFVVNPTNYVSGSIVFSWYEGNNTDPQFFRLLLRVGGKWYASTTTFTTPAVALTSFGTQAQLKTITYNPAAANWLEVNFDGDYTLGDVPGTGFGTGSSLGDVSLGAAPAADLSGSITAFGVYGENGGTGTGNRRIDTFTIEAAPVTSSAKPRIAMSIAGDQLTINVSNGPAGWNVRVLASNDIAVPLSAWLNVKSGTFDAAGNYSATITIDPTQAQQFFTIQSP